MSAGVTSLPYDGHVHTTFSDGRDTLTDCVRAAEAAGLRCLAITDHFYHQPGANPADWAKAIIQADAASAVTVVPGAEVVILNPSGDVSITREGARYFRWIIADFGTRTTGVGCAVPATVQGFLKNVEMAMVKAAANPVVDAIAHPFNLGRWEAKLNPEDLPEDMLRRIAEAMAANECAYE
ncbi:MAG: PHP domain-containing protein, partial [Armatimonadetes bacterium]|nr:PHP domain-containing protein [Armatimonadota bacterium]